MATPERMEDKMGKSDDWSKPEYRAVSEANLAYRLERIGLETEVRNEMQRRLDERRDALFESVRAAHDAGISKASIARALGAKSTSKVDAALSQNRSER